MTDGIIENVETGDNLISVEFVNSEVRDNYIISQKAALENHFLTAKRKIFQMGVKRKTGKTRISGRYGTD